jgi:hypothetical protein
MVAHMRTALASALSIRVATFACTALAFTALTACGNADDPYKAQPAWTGRKATLPAPAIAAVTIKKGDVYTVEGISHQLRSRLHGAEVNGKEVTIEGYIVSSNIETAPACALHKTGKEDPQGCKTEIPSFYIADAKGDTKGPKIRVLGFAKNFAVVFEAMEKYSKLKEPPKEKDVVKDETWSVDVPYPLPAVGAKVKVSGTYGYSFSKSTTGSVSDPTYGVMTYKKIEVLEPAATPAAFQNKKP